MGRTSQVRAYYLMTANVTWHLLEDDNRFFQDVALHAHPVEFAPQADDLGCLMRWGCNQAGGGVAADPLGCGRGEAAFSVVR